MIPKNRDDALMAIKSCAQAHGDRFDLTACALACAIHENPNRDVRNALDILSEMTSKATHTKPASPEAFARFMFADLGFGGHQGDYDDPANADLIDILETKKGLPIGLGHIWRHVARVIGIPLHGTDTPGHFIMRFETQSEPVFLDPFEGGAIVDTVELAAIAQRAGLERLNDAMVRPVSDRVMAVRLQTNLVARSRERGDVEAWVRAAHRRAVLAPENFNVALDYSQAAEAAGLMKIALHWSELAYSLPTAPNHAQMLAEGDRSQTLRHKLN